MFFLLSQYLFSSLSVNSIITTVYDSGAAYNFAGIWGQMSNLCGKEDRNFASWCEKYEPKVEQEIEKMVTKVEAMQ